MIKITDTSEEDVKKKTKSFLLDSNSRPSAILAATDSIAIFVMNQLLKMGIKIPEDISICGIDNIHISQHSSIQLTSVGDSINKNMGEIAITHLIDIIEMKKNDVASMQITLDPKLFDRKTTAYK